jgi:hypothetical protein
LESDFIAGEVQLCPDLERAWFPFPLNRSNLPDPLEEGRLPTIGRLIAASAPDQ